MIFARQRGTNRQIALRNAAQLLQARSATRNSRIFPQPVRGEKTLADLAQQFDVHPNQITQWKSQLQEGAAGVFGPEAHADPATPRIDIKSLHAKIGELTLENDFLEGALGKAGLLSARR
jgi:transposase